MLAHFFPPDMLVACTRKPEKDLLDVKVLKRLTAAG